MRNFILISTLSFLSSYALAQYDLTGSVHDANGFALPGATVQLIDTDHITITDERGRFGFFDVPSGEYVIAFRFLGYSDKSETVNLSEDQDLSINLEESAILTETVVISATRATDKTPTTYSMLTKEKIQQQNFGYDLPFLLNWTPSVVTTSDAGTGIGYTGIRIRGSDPTRINVTINGIPYNDSESLGTFWVDIPDIASSSQSIQVQRGVGTSTNGSGAFGATINVQSNTRNDEAYGQLINSFGSFNSLRHTLSVGSGLLNNHWVIDGRISKIVSDGYIDRATADLQSYYFSAAYYSNKTIIKAITFGGKERTYQSWYGVPESRLNNDTEAMLITAANEGWNEEQTNNLLNSESRTFNPYFYKNQVDDYQQDHYQLHFSQHLNESFTLNTALHYTPGKGYYEEYRFDDAFENYGVDPVTIGDSVISSSDIIRRRWLDNDFYGITYSLNFDRNRWNVIYGGAWNRYDGNHFGEIIWAEVSTVPIEYTYYFNNGDKRDFNNFLKANYQIGDNLNAFVDLQLRKVQYKIAGIENDDLNTPLHVDETFNFFNPKAGLTYVLDDRNQLYGSYSVGNREPVRDDFLSFPGNSPKPEKMGNLEIGYRGAGKGYTFLANYYLMNYKDQLVLTGEVNDVGAFVRKNAGESYRMGMEMQAAFRLSHKLNWTANLTLSRNKIKAYTEILEDYGDNFDEYHLVENTYRDTDISFSPAIVGASTFAFQPFKGSEIALMSKYVGQQYLDNTSDENRKLDPYFVNDLRLTYTWKPSFIREIGFSFLINNILDEAYESNGYTWGYLAGAVAYRENYYFPQAGRNFMAMISLKF